MTVRLAIWIAYMSHKLSSFYLFNLVWIEARAERGKEERTPQRNTMIHNSIVNSMGCQYKFSIYLLHLTWMWINNTRMYWSHSAQCCELHFVQKRSQFDQKLYFAYVCLYWCLCVENIDSQMLAYAIEALSIRCVPARIVTSYLIYFCHFSRCTFGFWLWHWADRFFVFLFFRSLHSTSVSKSQFP